MVKGTSINFAGAIFRDILGFFYVFLLAKFLNTNDLGLYYLGVSVVSTLAIISMAGTDMGIRRFVSIYHGAKDVGRMHGTLVTAFIVVVPLSIILGLALYLSSGTIANNIFSKPALSNVLKVLSLYLPFFAITSLCLAATQAMKYMQYKVYSMDMANTILKFIFISIFFYFGLHLFGAVSAFVLSMVVVTGLSIYFLRKVFPQNGQGIKASLEFKNLFSFSIPQTFSNLLGRILKITDTLMLGYFILASGVGIYNVASRLLLLGSFIFVSFNTMFAPMIADLHHQGKHNQLEDLYKIVTKWVVTLSLPIFLFLIFFSNQILEIFGSDFVLGSTCLVILCIGQIINAATGPSGLMILMSGRPYINFFNNALALLLNVLLNLLLIPKYGIVGAAIATSLSMGFVNILKVIQVYYFMRIHPYRLSYLKLLFAGIACILIATFGFKNIVTGTGFWPLVMACLGFLCTYWGCLFILKLDDADCFVLRKIGQRIALVR